MTSPNIPDKQEIVDLQLAIEAQAELSGRDELTLRLIREVWRLWEVEREATGLRKYKACLLQLLTFDREQIYRSLPG